MKLKAKILGTLNNEKVLRIELPDGIKYKEEIELKAKLESIGIEVDIPSCDW